MQPSQTQRLRFTAPEFAAAVLTALLLMANATLTASAATADTGVASSTIHSADTIVYHGGGKRVHVKGCRRLTTDPAELAAMTKMTLGEAEAKGLPLCSRCPGSTTSGLGNPEPVDPDLPESWVNPAPDHVTIRAFRPDPRSPLISLGDDGKLHYAPFSDRGDRLLDWSYCGYKRSEVPLPAVRTVQTLNPLPGNAAKVGNLRYPIGPDSRGRIQAAIDRVADMRPGPDGYRGAVMLTRGIYYVEGGLSVPAGVVLRGEGDGPDGTVLIAYSDEGGGNIIQVGDPGARYEFTGEADAVRIAQDYVPTSSNELRLTDARQFEPGDYICIRKTVNEQWIEDLGVGERLRHIRGGKEGANKRPWKPESYQFRHIRRIDSVRGNTITLDVMLPQSFAVEHGGGEVFKVDAGQIDSLAGVESLRMVSNYDTTVTDESKSSNFLNFRNGIHVTGIHDAFVRDCTVMHIYYACVAIDDNTRHVTVRDCTSLQPIGPKRGGFRYTYSIGGGSLHLVYNCYAEDGRHDFVGGSRTMGPYAFVRGTAVRGGQSEPHHRWGTGYLFDNIDNPDGNIAAINRGDSGSGHGWAAANTLIWNCNAKNIVVFDPETPGENNFAVGYTGSLKDEYETNGLMYANTRAGYWGTPREGAYYGYALMGNGHIESPDGPVEPDSLFEQQLIDRIGKEQAMRVIGPR